MALSEQFLHDDIYPIDIVEHIAEHHDWEFDRIGDDQNYWDQNLAGGGLSGGIFHPVPVLHWRLCLRTVLHQIRFG